jgi:hypothetical protein
MDMNEYTVAATPISHWPRTRKKELDSALAPSQDALFQEFEV